jgi:ABC-type multidrug transport system fused ATPase/permease subunit
MKEILHTINNFQWVFNPLEKSSKTKLFTALVLILASSFIVSLIPKYIGEIIDSAIEDKSLAYWIISLIAILFAFDIAFEVVRKYFIESTATKAQKELIVKTSERLIKLDLGWISAQRSGGLNGRIQRSVEGSIKLLKLISMDFAPNIFQMILAVCIAFFTNTYIGCILSIAIVIGLFTVYKQIKSQKGIRISLLRAREENDANIVELLTGIESVRVANEENKQIKRIENINENLRVVELKHHVKMMTFDSLKKLNIVVWHIVILVLGVFLASRNIITTGEIVVFNLLFNNVLIPLQSVHRFIDEAQEASLKTTDLRELFLLPIDSSFCNIQESVNHITDNKVAVSIKDLHFSFNGKTILKGINYCFEKGKYYGIIGSTGCGKSTLLRLVMNLIHSQNGEVIVFGQNIVELSREEISNYITFMPQNPYVFQGTIRENLLFGSKTVYPDSELFWALQQVCLFTDINKFEQKLDYVINERGNNLSGGQKQRIALARIFLNAKNKKSEQILILDEATSALDIATEEMIINNLLSIVDENTTLIAIAHRYSTLKESDEILILENGSIQETTSYNKLIRIEQVEYSDN